MEKVGWVVSPSLKRTVDRPPASGMIKWLRSRILASLLRLASVAKQKLGEQALHDVLAPYYQLIKEKKDTPGLLIEVPGLSNPGAISLHNNHRCD